MFIVSKKHLKFIDSKIFGKMVHATRFSRKETFEEDILTEASDTYSPKEMGSTTITFENPSLVIAVRSQKIGWGSSVVLP